MVLSDDKRRDVLARLAALEQKAGVKEPLHTRSHIPTDQALRRLAWLQAQVDSMSHRRESE